jgi:hypothetical protein
MLATLNHPGATMLHDMKTSNRSTARGLWRRVGAIAFLVPCLAVQGAL